MQSKTIAIIGTGAVGSAAAQAIVERAIASDLLLYDIRCEAANACCMDLQDALPLLGNHCRISVASSLEQLKDADIIVLAFTAGICANRPDELAANLEQLRPMAQQLAGFKGILLIASNPNDAMVFHARRLFNLPAARVIGTGTSLDSARLVARISRDLNVAAAEVSANMLGEHGDSQIGHFSAANVGGVELSRAYELRGVAYSAEVLANDTAYRGHEIFRLKGKTEYGIGAAIARIAAAILRGERAQICVSFTQDDDLSISPQLSFVVAGAPSQPGDGCVLGRPSDDGCVAYSRPAIISAVGIESVPPLCASASELAALAKSIAFIKQLC